jgi:hypothetical protein
MTSKRQLRMEVVQLRESLNLKDAQLKEALITARLGTYALAELIEPNEDEMVQFETEFPRWSIEIVERESLVDDDLKHVKVFRRSLIDLKPELHGDRDTYLRLTDPEYFDWGIMRTFESTSLDPDARFFGTGEYRGAADGSFKGGHIEVSVETGPEVTKLDLYRAELVERYLMKQGLFAEPELATT